MAHRVGRQTDRVAIIQVQMANTEDLPTLPVAPFRTTSMATLLSAREKEVHEVDDRVLAELVRMRLVLEKARGWLLLSGLATTAAAIVAVCIAVDSRLLRGILCPLVATVPFTLGLATDRALWAWFLRRARGHGLSETASKRIWDAATGADHWIAVLTSCGRPPSDHEVAQFVMR